MAVPDCTTPLWDMMINQTMQWIPCSLAVNAGGVLVVGTFMYMFIASILLNWTESIYPPAVWTALMSGLVFTLLPAALVMRIAGLITIVFAFGIVTLWHAWRR